MPDTTQRQFDLPTPEDTAALAAQVARAMVAGDTLLLSGEIGAGKSHFARALIQTRMAMLGAVEDVPSPTFTLIQTYDLGAVEIWHADLYRLSGPGDCIELGLDTAFETAVCLIEWPDRLGNMAPAQAIRVTLTPAGDGRQMIAEGPEETLARLFDTPSQDV